MIVGKGSAIVKSSPACLLLAGALALTLTACGPGAAVAPSPTASPATVAPEERPTPTPVPTSAPTSAPTPDPAPESLVQADDVPPGDYAPWQLAYADFLREQRRQEAETADRYAALTPEEQEKAADLWAQVCDASDLYRLYDVDKDGVPELFVQYGNCEAAYHTTCYTFRDGQMEEAGSFPSGHASLYSCPGESAFLFSWGHMGQASLDKVSMADGRLGDWEGLLEEDCTPGANGGEWKEYTEPGALVPGAEYLPAYRTPTQWRPLASPPLTLPVFEYGVLPRQASAPLEEAEVRAAIGKALWEGAVFTGVSGDGFDGDTGPVTLEEYLQPGAAYPYNKKPLTVLEYAWADVNGDGQTDCVLRLGEESQGQSEDSTRHYTVLSAENGALYGYFFSSRDGLAVDPDGTVYFQWYDFWEQVSFYENQCYTVSPSRDPAEGADLAWEVFSPAP